MLLALGWLDHGVIGLYLLVMLFIGWRASRKQAGEEEYFLASRSVPWYAVGLSLIATLLSSLTYLSEPGEVWKSGVTNMFGKMLAIPCEMLIIYCLFIPFLMRFRFASAYEYLEHRYSYSARLLGVGLFCLMTLTWMGFVVLVTSRALSQVTGFDLMWVIAIVGVVSTVYTVMGGFRAVIWTDVVQILCMLAGALLAIGFVMWQTGSFLSDWYDAALTYRTQHQVAKDGVKWMAWSPFERTSVVTIGLSMFLWHLCTHAGNQMSVQRYFASTDMRAARKSFVTASLMGVALNLLLAVTGLSILYYYVNNFGQLPWGWSEVGKHADEIFPLFMVNELPAGLAGAVLSAVLGAAMSTIDSGINSLATVLCLELQRRERPVFAGSAESAVAVTPETDLRTHSIRVAQWITLIAGLLITGVAYGMHPLTNQRNIVEMMSRSFNCFTAPMGAMFLVGMAIPFVSGRAIVPATWLGLLVALGISFSKELSGWGGTLYTQVTGQPLSQPLLPDAISFTWVLPGSILTVAVAAVALSLVFRPTLQQTLGLTWWTSHLRPEIDAKYLK